LFTKLVLFTNDYTRIHGQQNIKFDITCLLLVDYCRLLLIMHGMNTVTSPELLDFRANSVNSPFKRLSLAKNGIRSDYSKTSSLSPVKLRVKSCPVHGLKAYRGSRRKALLNLNLGVKLG